MKMPRHYWIVERNPLEVGVILAAHGEDPGYFIQDASGEVRRPSQDELLWLAERLGPVLKRDAAKLNSHPHSNSLLNKAAAARPYAERTSSAKARQHDF